MKIRLYKILFILLILVCCPLFLEGARGQTENLEERFSQAQAEPELRVRFIASYVQQEGLPEHVLQVLYSEEVKMLAVSNPLVRTKNGNHRPTSHALAMGRGYPSRMTFGPKMFHPAYNYADFQSVVQHEAAHAKFWATGALNYLDDVDTSENSKVRLRGLFPILFELDAIKTQTEHSCWQQTSELFRRGQMAYRQKWLDKLAKLGQQSFMYDMKPLLKRIRRTYE
ncbi:MAG: hypothetical protein ABUK17_07175 [Syntrophobacteria bacterium]